MALTAGNVTIKNAGGTYSSWEAFWNDLGNLTGDITCTVDASAFTESTAPAAVTESLNGYTLHVLPASFPTKTDASDGARFTCNYTANILDLEMEGSGDVIIEGMVFIEGTSTPLRAIFLYLISTEFNITIRRNIVKGCGTGIYNRGIPMNSGTKIYNNICFDQYWNGLEFKYDAPLALYANNTVDNCHISGVEAGYEEIILENFLVYGSNSSDYYNIATLVEGNNTAASDTSNENADWGGGGSNNVSSIADPFNNLAADDFTITTKGVIGIAGKDLSAKFTDDFFGVTRVNWTIGACEYVVPVLEEYAVSITMVLTAPATRADKKASDTTLAVLPEAGMAAQKPVSASMLVIPSVVKKLTRLPVTVTLTIDAELDSSVRRRATTTLVVSPSITPKPKMPVSASMVITQPTSKTNSNWGWLLIPDYQTWKGEWVAETQYSIGDTVLYNDGALNHVFKSITSHNVGNIPSTSVANWFRLYQGAWSK